MTKPNRYLRNMSLFVVAVLVLAVVLILPLRDAFMANMALNGVILATLVIGIVFIFRQVLMLKPEITWIENYRREESVTSISEPPRLLAPMASLLGDEQRGRMRLSTLSMRSLLDGIASRLDEGREISRYLIGLLIFLGLLGTFWGLLGTISAIGDTIRSLSVGTNDLTIMFDDLKRGLETPLSGMATAFSSSLFGLAGSVILGFLDLQAGQAQNRFYNDLEEWLSSVTKLSRGGPSLGEGEDASVPAYVSALLEQSADSLDNLQRLFTRAEEERGDINGTLLGLSERLEALADRMGEKRQEPMLDEASRGHLRNLDVHLKRVLEEQTKGRDQLIGELRSEIKLLARTIGTAMDLKMSQRQRGPGGDDPQ